MSDDKNPLDRALELFVFAPVGLAASARELLPQLVERGREQLSGQVSMARVIGQFAVQQGGVEAGKTIDRARTSAQQALEELGVVGSSALSGPPAAVPAPTPTGASAPAAAPAPAPASTPSAPSDAAADLTTEVAPALGDEVEATVEEALEPLVDATATPTSIANASGATAVDAGSLAIPDYDSLSASQVVPRLVGLTSDELEAVGRYESARRGRKTILNRVDQLRAG